MELHFERPQFSCDGNVLQTNIIGQSIAIGRRLLAFDQAKLATAIEADPTLRRTLESALNRNLAGKLSRSNTAEMVPDNV